MFARFVWLVAFVVWTAVVLVPVATPAPVAVAGCSGCVGNEPPPDQASAGPGSICFVRISAVVSPGQCRGTAPGCIGQACEVLVMRSWRLPYGTKMNYCHRVGPDGVLMCEKPQLVATHDMSVQSSTVQDSVACGKYKTFSLGATACGAPMEAKLVATCSACQ